MVDQQLRSHGTQPPPSTDRGHPLPRRTCPEKSVTLRNHRLARDATIKANPRTGAAAGPSSSPRRNSSGESHNTGHSDPKRWFDRSNRNPTATFDDANNMDIDPPFFQKESDSSNDEPRERNLAFPYAYGARVPPRLRPAVTHSSSADDYRSVIDDLTIENKRLKEELKRYKQFGPDMLRKEKLFEIKVHGLGTRKKRELEATLRDFAANLEGSSDSPSQRRKPGRHVKNLYSSGESMSKHASSSSSHSRPLDSAYASMSTGPSSAAPNSSGPSLGRPSIGSRAKASENKLENYVENTPVGLLPRHMAMTDKERKKLVVRRLEQLFTGKISGRNMHRNQSMTSVEAPAPTEFSVMAPPRTREGSREARILQLHDPLGKKTRSRGNLSISNSHGDRTESGGGHGVGDGSGSCSRSGNNPSPEVLPPEQRPTRPRDLDPYRTQVPSENMEYIRHLGLVPPESPLGKKPQRQDVSPDADGWVYLNLLCNLAQLHMINVTPSFIRHAVSEMSTKFQLSPDGRKIRWRGGSHGTKFSSDSSGDNSQKSPSTDDTDESSEGGQRKKQRTGASGDALASAPSSKESKFGPQATGSSGSFHYKPLFIHRSSSMETSLDDTGSHASYGAVEDSYPGNNSRWDFSGSGSSQRKKRRHDGAIIYYSGAPFCTDLSGDPGEMSPTTYMTSTGQRRELDLQAFRPVLQRSLSGSSLPIRPLSDDRAIVCEAMDTDLDMDSPPELVTDEGDSANEDFELPWCDDPETAIIRPLEPTLEPCGLGGIVPEDHFAVVVTTRRPITKLEKSRQNRGFRARSEDVTDSIAGRLASMTTSSPAPFQKYSEHMMEIEYLSGIIQRFRPVELPPAAMFIPPFSTDSDSSGGDDLLDSEEEDESEELSSEGLISQRANPHNSDNMDPDAADLSSNDEEDEVDADNEVTDLALRSSLSGLGQQRLDSGQRVTSGSTAVTGKRPDVLDTGSSAATAGGAESGYNSSMEDDAQ